MYTIIVDTETELTGDPHFQRFETIQATAVDPEGVAWVLGSILGTDGTTFTGVFARSDAANAPITKGLVFADSQVSEVVSNRFFVDVDNRVYAHVRYTDGSECICSGAAGDPTVAPPLTTHFETGARTTTGQEVTGIVPEGFTVSAGGQLYAELQLEDGTTPINTLIVAPGFSGIGIVAPELPNFHEVGGVSIDPTGELVPFWMVDRTGPQTFIHLRDSTGFSPFIDTAYFVNELLTDLTDVAIDTTGDLLAFGALGPSGEGQLTFIDREQFPHNEITLTTTADDAPVGKPVAVQFDEVGNAFTVVSAPGTQQQGNQLLLKGRGDFSDDALISIVKEGDAVRAQLFLGPGSLETVAKPLDVNIKKLEITPSSTSRTGSVFMTIETEFGSFSVEVIARNAATVSGFFRDAAIWRLGGVPLSGYADIRTDETTGEIEIVVDEDIVGADTLARVDVSGPGASLVIFPGRTVEFKRPMTVSDGGTLILGESKDERDDRFEIKGEVKVGLEGQARFGKERVLGSGAGDNGQPVIATASISGSVSNEKGTFFFDIAGTEPGEGHDQLLVQNGDVFMDGMLDITWDPSFSPSEADLFDLIVDLDGTPIELGNQFSVLSDLFPVRVIEAALDDGILRLVLGDPPAQTADFDGNGVVNDEDYALWQQHFGASGISQNQGDANGNGFGDGEDFLAWQGETGMASAGQNTAIPEPSSWFLVLICVVVFGTGCRLTGVKQNAN